ncbi:hypothetical protein Cgig2_023586 [Carnegiea gigantea]|uniref:Uncharacterized protein n=1 Tax=Carnegiea gigantea TaxID=171969 RepID=A0A9Q1GLL3_9CARY|nr:hypothetical protein Cgig2_023586 [Carnegiea gigantea]
MGVNLRRVTDPFNEKIRARIFATSMASYISSSSGSEHDAETDVVSPSSSTSPSSLCLSHLVQNFLEDDSAGDSPAAREFDSDSDSAEFSRSDLTPVIVGVINPIVTRAVEIFSVLRKNKSIFNRNLMSYLREIGYNAGVCKTRWGSSGGLTAGNYECIDVLAPDSPAPARYIIDTDFAGGFEIARETESYSMLRSSLPRIFIGKPDDLKRIIRSMCDEAKRSMKLNGLTLPPWRKNRYMQAKWLGPYRRITNYSPATAISSSVVSNFAVKCRSVGFDLAGDGGRLLVQPATKTR